MSNNNASNIVDRVVSWWDPVAGARRAQARMQLAIAGQWLGGRTDRRQTAGWLPFAGSADADNLTDLPTLRTRSRDMQRGEPLARGATNTVVTNAVATGLMLKSVIDRDVLKLSAAQAAKWQRTTEQKFRGWAWNPYAFDLAGKQNFGQNQELALRSALDSGDVFALMPMRARKFSRYSLKVQLIEADRVCNRNDAPDSDTLAGGIERDIDGFVTAYHIMRTHPGSQVLSGANREWDRIPAFGTKTGRRNVIHLMEMLRPEQSRGIPYLAAVIEPLKQLGKYTNAELDAAVVSALFTVFVKTPGGVGIGLNGAGGAPTSAPKSGDNVMLRSGAIVDLAKGEEIQIADPKRPNQAFDPFVLAILRQIGVALELPFEVLVKHFTASYTAARAALLQASKFFLKKREWLACGYCDPIYHAWLEEAVALGEIAAPGFLTDPTIRAAYCGSEWIGDSFGLLDPLKEAQAVEKWLELKLTSLTDEAARNFGTEWETTAERRAREQEILREYDDTQPAADASGAENSSGKPGEAAPGEQKDTDTDIED